MFAVVSLRQLAHIYSAVLNDAVKENECLFFAAEIDEALHQYAILDHTTHGKLYPLEIDGFGNALFMDDANVPNLLSLPYLELCNYERPVIPFYPFFFPSDANPWYHEGRYAKGIGGPHVGENKDLADGAHHAGAHQPR